MIVAITREVSDALGACELTHLTRTPIDIDLARRQHRGYEDALRKAGCQVVSLPALHELPDAVFVEDVAIVLDELVIVTRPGAESRRAEVEPVAEMLRAYRAVARVEEPGTLDGGDVLRLGTRLFVGLSGRTNTAAVEQLRRLATPHGYSVTGVAVTGCLHLKSAVTEIAPGTILVNPAWVDPWAFGEVEVVDVAPGEPYGANALLVRGAEGLPALSVLSDAYRGEVQDSTRHVDGCPATPTLIYPASFPQTRRIIESRRIPLEIVDVSELQKAEGAVTCCSLLLRRT